MSTADVIVSVGTSSVLGLTVTLLVPVAARSVVRAHIERRSSTSGRGGLTEVDDIFSPGRRHQIDHQVAVDNKRFDDWVGEGDPLSIFPAARQVRGDLDPDGIDQARHDALERPRNRPNDAQDR